MQITKCDRCGMEIEQGMKKFRVDIATKTEGEQGIKDMVTINDLCERCHMELEDFFHPPVSRTKMPKKNKTEDEFWKSHDPSGGDLPLESEKENVTGDAEKKAERSEDPTRQQEEKTKRERVDHGKLVALWKAGWSVKEICAEMHISPATASNHLKMEKENEEKKGM